MRGFVRYLVSGLATAALAVILATLSGLPYDAGAADSTALLRLSWRTRAAAVRECREPTPEELAGLPAHMRRDRICDRRVPPHRLRVAVDGRILEDARIEAAGARQDRPLYVHREFPLVPGVHELEVRFFVAEEASGIQTEGRGEGDAEDRSRPEPERAIQTDEDVRLVLRERVELATGEVVLVTHDPEAGHLVLRRSGIQ